MRKEAVSAAALVVAAIDELKARGIEHAHVVTATDNEAAQRTYFQCGFRRHATVEVHRGVRARGARVAVIVGFAVAVGVDAGVRVAALDGSTSSTTPDR